MNIKDINKFGSYEANIKRRDNLKNEFSKIEAAIVDAEISDMEPMSYVILHNIVDKRKKEIEEELLSLPEETNQD